MRLLLCDSNLLRSLELLIELLALERLYVGVSADEFLFSRREITSTGDRHGLVSTYLVNENLGNGPLAVFLSNVGLDIGTLVDLVQPLGVDQELPVDFIILRLLDDLVLLAVLKLVLEFRKELLGGRAVLKEASENIVSDPVGCGWIMNAYGTVALGEDHDKVVLDLLLHDLLGARHVDRR